MLALDMPPDENIFGSRNKVHMNSEKQISPHYKRRDVKKPQEEKKIDFTKRLPTYEESKESDHSDDNEIIIAEKPEPRHKRQKSEKPNIVQKLVIKDRTEGDAKDKKKRAGSLKNSKQIAQQLNHEPEYSHTESLNTRAMNMV